MPAAPSPPPAPRSRTFAIDRRSRVSGRGRGRTIALVVGLTILGLAILAVGAVLGLAWYAEDKARTKLADLGARAGLSLSVGAIVIEPYTFIEIRDVVVTDPADGVVMARVARVITDLTLGEVRAGKRMPGQVSLVGLEADFTDVLRWKRAMERFRGKETPKAEAPVKTVLPTLTFTGATFWVPDPVSGVPLLIEEAAARLAGPEDGRRLRASFTGLIEKKHRVVVDARIDTQGKENEAGVTFDPPLQVSLGESGPRLGVSGVFAKQGERVRLSGVNAELSGGISGAAEAIELVIADAHPFPSGVLHLEISGATGEAFGAKGTAGRVAVDIAAGNVNQLPARIRNITVERATGELGAALAAASIQRIEVTTDGIMPDAPLSKVREIQISGADLALVLPAPGELEQSPLGRRLQALLGDVSPRGGGPAEVEAPSAVDLIGPPAPSDAEPASSRALDAAAAGQRAVGRLRRLFGDRPPPRVVFRDTSIALLAGEPIAPAFLVQRFSARLEPEAVTGALVGSLTGKLHELATDEDDSFHLEARFTSEGVFESAKARVSGRKLARQLPQIWSAFRVEDSSSVNIDLAVTPTAGGHGLTVSGTGGVRDIGFFSPRIHGGPVKGITVEGDFTASYDLESDALTLDVPRLLIDDALTLRLGATVERLRSTFAPPSGTPRRKPKLSFKLEMPRQSCGAMVTSIPREMAPRLNDLVLEGTSEGHLAISVDLEAPRTYEQDIDIDMRLCRPIAFGNADVPRLQTDFVQDVVEKGIPIGVTVGPGTWHYRALNRIPKYVQLGALYTEDHSFYQHAGFRPPLIRRAVIMNLEGGRYVYGGSTITQQLVKNLFLSREKTLTRKLEEAFIVWLLERTLTKDRILELYLNCIEYGPSIYGIENAGRAYFGKHVEELDALEMAFLMGLKPYPWAGWDQFERGFVKPWWHRRLSKILIGMARSGWITQEQLAEAEAVNWEPAFLTSPARPPPKRPDPADDGALPIMPGDADLPATAPKPERGDEPAPGPAPFEEDDLPAREEPPE